MTRFRCLLAGLFLVLPATAAWGQNLSLTTVALANPLGQEAPESAPAPAGPPPTCFAEILHVTRPAETSPQGYMLMWRLMWDCGLFDEAQRWAAEAAQHFPNSVDAQHALVVSEIVNAVQSVPVPARVVLRPFGIRLVDGGTVSPAAVCPLVSQSDGQVVKAAAKGPGGCAVAGPCLQGGIVQCCAVKPAGTAPAAKRGCAKDCGCHKATGPCSARGGCAADCNCQKSACGCGARCTCAKATCGCGANCACGQKSACACGPRCACAKAGCACGPDCPCTKRVKPRRAVRIHHPPHWPPAIMQMRGLWPHPPLMSPPVMQMRGFPMPPLMLPAHGPWMEPIAAPMHPPMTMMPPRPMMTMTPPYAQPVPQGPLACPPPYAQPVQAYPYPCSSAPPPPVDVVHRMPGFPMPPKPPLSSDVQSFEAAMRRHIQSQCPVLHHDMTASPVSQARTPGDRTIRITPGDQGMRVTGPNFEATCDGLTMHDAHNRILLEGHVRIDIRRDHHPARIEASRVLVDLANGTFEVNPPAQVPMPRRMVPSAPVSRPTFTPARPQQVEPSRKNSWSTDANGSWIEFRWKIS